MSITKHLFISIIGLLSFVSVKAQTSDCSKFKLGTFKMTHEGKTIVIKRDSTHQYEYYSNSTDPISFEIKWISNCTYTLKPDAINFRRFPNTPKNALITVKIISYKGNAYKISASSNFNSLILENEITKIN